MSLQTLRSAWLGAIAIGLPAFVLPHAHAQDTDQAALAAALKNTPTTLEQGLKTSERTGKPISAKFEIEDGKLQLSVYTTSGEGYTEVVVAPDSGAVRSTEKIASSEDLEAAASQKAAMDKATMSLLAVTEKAVGQNAGSRAVSAFPELKGGQPVATVTLLREDKFVTVPEKLS
jgi:hypothetical protein